MCAIKVTVKTWDGGVPRELSAVRARIDLEAPIEHNAAQPFAVEHVRALDASRGGDEARREGLGRFPGEGGVIDPAERL